MRKLFLAALFLLTLSNIQAQQNHVPNCSFEDTLRCPSWVANVNTECAQWSSFIGSADYFNVCAPAYPVGVPANYFGYQQPVHGNAYCGLGTYDNLFNNFEYLETQITPLTVNAVYEVSTSVSLGESCNSATNNLGIFFYDSGYSSTPIAPSNTFQSMIPQVHYSNYGIIDDTANWVRLTKYFVADSAYDNIMIGGFKDSTNSYQVDSSKRSDSLWAYYYIDSVVIKQVRSALTFSASPFCAGDTITAQYFVSNYDGFFKSNNTFRLQLSDSSGSFSNPINIGTKVSNSSGTITGVIPSTTITGSGYRIRMISTNGKDTTVDNGTNIHINSVHFVTIFPAPSDKICSGDKVTFTALPGNSTGTPLYQWFVNGQPSVTGNIFTTTTLNDQDIVRCDMTETNKCGMPYTDESDDIQMSVLPWLAPSVSITANPNHPLDLWEYVTYTAVTTDAGSNPKYQWKRNGKDIVGATSNTWSTNMLNENDSISVEITSDHRCPQPTTAKSNYIKVQMTGVDDIASFDGLKLYPNPNRGKFVVEAPPFLPQGEVMLLQVVNTLGQVVYSDNITPVNGVRRQEIDLQNMASGVYLLRVNSGDGKSASLRFRVE